MRKVTTCTVLPELTVVSTFFHIIVASSPGKFPLVIMWQDMFL